MHCLLFSIGPARYALPFEAIVEVVPLVNVQLLPGAPRGVVGLINHRGRPVPVIDLKLHLLGEACEATLSSRIIIVTLEGSHQAGLMCEKVTESESFEAQEFGEHALTLPGALHLGPVRVDGPNFLQMVLPDKLLTPELQALFQSGSAA